MMDKKDNINHPAHYETGSIECIDVLIETQGAKAVQSFCICNAIKYLYRWQRKNGIEDTSMTSREILNNCEVE